MMSAKKTGINTPSLMVQVLGCSGAIEKGKNTTAFLLNKSVLIDAGTGVANLSIDEMNHIDHVFLTHAHLDHIAGLPLLIDSCASTRTTPLTVHALPETISALRTHIFNEIIWPDFTKIPSCDAPSLAFSNLNTYDSVHVSDLTIEVLPAFHTVPAVGYAVAPLTDSSGSDACKYWVYSGDTAVNVDFWTRINQLEVDVLFLESAFSDSEIELAHLSRHLCPSELINHLQHMAPDRTYPIYITHAKPTHKKQIESEIIDLVGTQASTSNPLKFRIRFLKDGDFLLIPSR